MMFLLTFLWTWISKNKFIPCMSSIYLWILFSFPFVSQNLQQIFLKTIIFNIFCICIQLFLTLSVSVFNSIEWLFWYSSLRRGWVKMFKCESLNCNWSKNNTGQLKIEYFWEKHINLRKFRTPLCQNSDHLTKHVNTLSVLIVRGAIFSKILLTLFQTLGGGGIYPPDAFLIHKIVTSNSQNGTPKKVTYRICLDMHNLAARLISIMPKNAFVFYDGKPGKIAMSDKSVAFKANFAHLLLNYL